MLVRSLHDDIVPHTPQHTRSSNAHPLISCFLAYLTALYLYETVGLWRKSDYLKIHFAETWNEQQ
jgi:hypothetical protein